MKDLAAFSMQVRKVIENYDPTAEYVFSDDDLDSITWVKFDKPVMSKAQIEKAMIELEKTEAAAQAAKASAKAELLAKLGITQEEASLLLS